jgi:hypothetical protein
MVIGSADGLLFIIFGSRSIYAQAKRPANDNQGHPLPLTLKAIIYCDLSISEKRSANESQSGKDMVDRFHTQKYFASQVEQRDIGNINYRYNYKVLELLYEPDFEWQGVTILALHAWLLHAAQVAVNLSVREGEVE